MLRKAALLCIAEETYLGSMAFYIFWHFKRFSWSLLTFCLARLLITPAPYFRNCLPDDSEPQPERNNLREAGFSWNVKTQKLQNKIPATWCLLLRQAGRFSGAKKGQIPSLTCVKIAFVRFVRELAIIVIVIIAIIREESGVILYHRFIWTSHLHTPPVTSHHQHSPLSSPSSSPPSPSSSSSSRVHTGTSSLRSAFSSSTSATIQHKHCNQHYRCNQQYIYITVIMTLWSLKCWKVKREVRISQNYHYHH